MPIDPSSSPNSKNGYETSSVDPLTSRNDSTGSTINMKEQTTPHDKVESESANSHIIDWDGPSDPQNPQNWPRSKRIGHVVLVSIITLLVNLSSTMFAPAAPILMENFRSHNSIVGSLTVTIYLLGFALGPLLIAPLSEFCGRLMIYHVCNVIFLAFTIACAVSTNIGMFLAFRFIAGCAGSAPLTNGGGTIADVIPQEKRGAAMGMYAVGPLIGPIIGPIMGGFIAERTGWRWTFWIIAIAAGVVTVLCFIIMRETYAPVLLARKTTQLRKETGDMSLVSKYDTGLSPGNVFKRALLRPIKLLLFSPIVSGLSVFCAFVFSLMFLLFTTFPTVFEQQYHFSAGISGLAYLGLGIGMMLGIVIFGRFSDRILKTHTSLENDRKKESANQTVDESALESAAKETAAGSRPSFKPEYRLVLMMYISPFLPIGFFIYGWTAYYQTHWIVPMIGTFIFGFAILFIMMPTQIYLVDVFGVEGAASALAANTVLRSLFGTFLPLAGPKMYETMGLGWGNSLLGFISLSFAPIPFIFFKYGQAIRERWPVKL